MAKPVNKAYHKIAETVDASVELGKVNQDGIISAFVVTSSGDGALPTPHYFQMDKTGSGDQKKMRKGGTIFTGPGTFQIDHGSNVKTPMPGVYIDSGTGDLVLRSDGDVRIEGKNIMIVSKGGGEDPDKNGYVEINAPNKIQISSKGTAFFGAVDQISIFASAKCFIEGSSKLNLIGKDIEQVSGSTVIKGSTSLGGLGTVEELKSAIRSLIS